MILRFLCLLFILSSVSFAQDTVHTIHSSSQLLAETIHPEDYPVGSRVLIISHEKKILVGIGIVKDDHFDSMPGGINVEIMELVGHLMIMPGDIIAPLNEENIRTYKIPGMNSLTLYKERQIPAEYKDLANFGVFTSEGHTLGKREWLISPFQIQYGLTDDVSVRVVNALWVDGYLNAGLKVKTFSNKWAKLTLNGLGAYKLQRQDWIAQFGGVLTMPTNSKFQQHLMFNATFDPQGVEAHRTKGLDLFQDSDIRSITEYVTDRWDRVLFGPVFNVERQTFGGTVSYMWIWNTFHVSLGMGTKDFTNLTFGSDGYYYVYDLFWRF